MRSLKKFFLLSFLFLLVAFSILLAHSSIFLPLLPASAQQSIRCPNQYLFTGNPESFTPRAAIVSCIQGNSSRVVIRQDRSQQAAPVGSVFSRNRSILGIMRDRTTGATLGLVSRSNQRVDHLVAAGFSDRESWYRFPYDSSGSLAFGWSVPGSGRWSPQTLVLRRGNNRTIRIGPRTNQNHTKNTDTPDLGSLDDPYFVDGAIVNARQYCSAAAALKSGWGYGFVSNTRDVNENEDVCQLAIEDCENKTGDTCFVTNQGGWRDYDPNAITLNVLVKCASREQSYFLQGEGEEIYSIVTQLSEESQQETLCSLYIYGSNEVLISPNTQQRTLVHTEPTPEGFVVNVLTGSIQITASNPSQAASPVVVIVRKGERYTFSERTDTGSTPVNLSTPERERIDNLPVVQMFLDAANWEETLPEMEGVKAEIEEFRKAVRRDFYRPPAIEINRLSFGNGIEIHKATVNLTEDVIFTIQRTGGVNAGNFRQFVSQRNAALVMGGIYGIGRWNLVSEGTPLSQGGSQYTLLTLDGSNQPQMSTLADSASQSSSNEILSSLNSALSNKNGNGSYYSWFELQSGPRLVRSGRATITTVSARAEGHETLDITSRTRRAGICISQDRSKLHYVMTAQGSRGVSLRQLAEIMASERVGCWDAMAMDGGDGPALAQGNRIIESPGRRSQPYMIVVHEVDQAPQPLRRAWDAFRFRTGVTTSGG